MKKEVIKKMYLILAVLLLGAGVSAAAPVLVLVEDFQAYVDNVEVYNLATPGGGGIWDTDGNSTGNIKTDAKDGSMTLKVNSHSSGDDRGAAVHDLDDEILEGEIGIGFFRFMSTDHITRPNLQYLGLHHYTGDDPIIDSNNNPAGITAGFGLVDHNGDIAGTTIDIITTAETPIVLGQLEQGQWYDVWIVADNAADTFDLYIRAVAGPGTGDPGLPDIGDLIDTGIPFGIPTTDSLVGMMFLCDDNPVRSNSYWIDDLYWDGSSGLNTSVAMNPVPFNHATVGPDLDTLCWKKPDPNFPGGTVTSNVYFGTTEPNALAPHYGYTGPLAEGTIESCVSLPGALDDFTIYYWVVDSIDDSKPAGQQLAPGLIWTFDTYFNQPPEFIGVEDQYIWLNNAGDPNTATMTIDATVTDDGLPIGSTLALLWEQVSGTEVTIDPNDQEDLTLVLPGMGTYEFRLTADDSDLSVSATVQVVVAANPCAAAQAMPDYIALPADMDNNCIVDIFDFSILASDWLNCNSLECP